MSGFPWHRVFHPLCGADPLTLAGLVARRGLPAPRGVPAFAVALASSAGRLPFTILDAALATAGRSDNLPPVFIIGFPRSGTTHLHNLMAASGVFGTVPPVRAAMPWEARTLAPVLQPFIDPYLPKTRLIDGVALRPDAPTEDEVGLANMAGGSYFHAFYFPSRFAEDYRAGLVSGQTPRRSRALRRYVSAMSWHAKGRPLLLKNPAYTAQVAMLRQLFPGARFVHIRRDPEAVFASGRRAMRATLRELAMQSWSEREVDEALLETYPLVMEAASRDAAGLDARSHAELSFEALVADPMQVLDALWSQLDLPDAPRRRQRIETYLRSIASYRPSRNRLSSGESEMLARRWPRQLSGSPDARNTGTATARHCR